MRVKFSYVLPAESIHAGGSMNYAIVGKESRSIYVMTHNKSMADKILSQYFDSRRYSVIEVKD
jgi:hypothetical protein